MDESTYPDCGDYLILDEVGPTRVLRVFFTGGEIKCAQCGLPVIWHDGFMDQEDMAI
jgi:hypothetical protein